MKNLRKFLSSWQNALALTLIAVFVITAIFAPLISPLPDGASATTFKVHKQKKNSPPLPPRPEAILGTNQYGADIFHTLIWGTRDALKFGLLITSFIFIIGAAVGTLSAFYKRSFGVYLLWLTDTLVAFPVIVAVVLINKAFQTYISSFLGPYMVGMLPINPIDLPPKAQFLMKIDPIAVSFVLLLWMPYARVMNSSVRQVMNNEYVIAAKTMGVKDLRIMLRHILPNAIQPLVSMAARDVGALVVIRSALVYLGLGISTPWASMLNVNRNYMFAPGSAFTYWWSFVPITLAILLFGLAWGLLGDGLNAALDPKDNL